MNKYIASSLQVDLAQVIIELARDWIDPHDLMRVVLDPPEHEEDLMDFIDRDDIRLLKLTIKVVKKLIKSIGDDPARLNALRSRMIELGADDDVECDDCGGILLKSCTCEG